jgi:hypothetical protein
MKLFDSLCDMLSKLFNGNPCMLSVAGFVIPAMSGAQY